jgi:hypothetical protein
MDSNDDLLDQLQHLRWLAKDLKIELSLRRLRHKYSPDQPRDDRGRWTRDGSNGAGVNRILDVAKRTRFSASRSDYQRCLNLCYPLLERFQPPGSDRNTWDFHKCMNACLGTNR